MNYEWVGRQKKVSALAQSPLEKGAGGLTLLSEIFFNRKGRKDFSQGTQGEKTFEVFKTSKVWFKKLLINS